MKILLRFVAFGLLVSLLLTKLSVTLNPKFFWPLSFLGFMFPFVYVFGVLLFAWLLLSKDWTAIILLLVLIWTWPMAKLTYATSEPQLAKHKIMIWNVKNFGLYERHTNMQTRQQIMAEIKLANPDILCLQEFYTNDQQFKNVEYIKDSLGYNYVHFNPSISQMIKARNKTQKLTWKNGILNQKWGVATFSKFPIELAARLDFQNSQVNDCIYSDIEIDGKLTRVFNVHYESVHLANQDYATIDSLESAQSTRWPAIRSILRKMKYANLRRAVQAEDVAKLVNSFDGRSIVCGDFNDIPISYTYHHTKGNLQDAFVVRGNGYGATYINNFPLFRIDYVLLDEQIQVKSYQRIEEVLSDHLGIVVGFE